MSENAALSVALDLTRLFNNRCVYCFAYAAPGAALSRTTISYESACTLLNIVSREFTISEVRFTGGEATLHPRLADLIHFASHHIRAPSITLMTNGRRLRQPAFCSQLYQAGLNKIQISLESCEPAVHDQMVGVKGAWAQTVEGIRTALRLRPDLTPRISVKLTVADLNRHTLDATILFIAQLGIRVVSLNVCAAAGRGADQTAIIPKVDERVPLVAAAQTLAHKIGLSFESHFSFDLCAEDPAGEGLRHYACGRGRAYLALDYQGNLLVCHSWGKVLGNLLAAGSVHALWNADVPRYHWHGRHLPDRCRACECLARCGGVCPIFRETFGCPHIYRCRPAAPGARRAGAAREVPNAERA
jgi:radical SAM protein with 4Fe4S-binding SPASM domain